MCQACGSVVEALPAEPVDLAAFVNGVLPPMESLPTTEEQSVLLVVARGHRALYEQLKAVVGELGHVRVIEDRRRDSTLLPREGRQGAPRPES